MIDGCHATRRSIDSFTYARAGVDKLYERRERKPLPPQKVDKKAVANLL